MRFSNFILIILLTAQAWAIDCQLSKLMGHPTLVQNEHFWTELGKIKPNDERAIKELIKSISPDLLTSSTTSAQLVNVVQKTVGVTHAAEKDIKKLSPSMKKHFDDYLKIINEEGVHGLFVNPAKWHYEKLPQYGPNAHGARLNDGYRVLFDVAKDGSVNVREVSKAIGH